MEGFKGCESEAMELNEERSEVVGGFGEGYDSHCRDSVGLESL